MDSLEKALPKLICNLSNSGKKQRSEKIVFDVLRSLKRKKVGHRPIKVFTGALKNTSPSFTMITKKVGGTKYQIPVSLKEGKDTMLGVKWLVSEYKENKRYKNLDDLLWESFQNEGSVVKRRELRNELGRKQRAFLKFLG